MELQHSCQGEKRGVRMDTERLKTIPFFCDFSTSDLEQASQFIRIKTYNRNAIIFMEGEAGNDLYIVLSGIVEINRYENGKKFVLTAIKEGDFFGEMSLFGNGEVRSANAEACEKSELLVIKRLDLKNFLESNPSANFKIVSGLIKRLRRTNDLIYDITFLDVRSRIYKQLLRLAEEHGIKLEQAIMINMRLTHQLIADMVGCTREMVSKVLGELQEAHIIDISKKRIIIKDRLLRYHLSS
jgi:CRP/FNR family cyclic AMP-dependent transcriptional regulator